MSLLKEWRDHAYGLDERTPEGNKFWLDYFQREKAIYEQLLEEPVKEVKGTVKELSEKYDMPLELMVGFLDGIEESLIKPNDIDNITEESEVSLLFDPEKLYMNMVGCNAEWLYTLPQWDKIFSDEKRKELYKIQKSSKTVVKPPKVGRNDPCPCGSGKKYKKCCGANA
ncbi:MAG: SEC-C domain-containing protein [Lachnospiraceae bacterium]|nr:SEC-C domain-containing protein [Lachnospiraceae bacterium]